MEAVFTGSRVMIGLLLILTCACGTRPAGDVDGSASSVSPEPSSVLSATASATSPGGGLSSSGIVSVSVTVDAVRYRSGDVITAEVVNNGRTIFTEDQKTGCSVLTLQRQQDADWVSVGTCDAERAPRTVVIGPADHSTVKVRLAGELDLRSGNHRLVLGFRLDREPQGVEPEQVVSPTFAIG